MAKAIPFLPARLIPSFCDIFMAAKSVHKKKLKKIKKISKNLLTFFLFVVYYSSCKQKRTVFERENLYVFSFLNIKLDCRSGHAT